MKQIPFDAKKNVIPAFITPIGNFKLPGAGELNRALESEILRHMQSEGGMTRSNVGGWHSNDDFFKRTSPAIQELKEWINAAVLRMVALASKSQRFTCQLGLTGWANVNGPGQYNANHNHPGCIWSGVYYVRAGAYPDDPLPKAGQLQFYDPRGSVNMIQHPGKSVFGHVINVKPADGLLVVFPAWLFHSVNPFMSDVRRISIAFNVQIRSFEAVEGEPEDDDREVAAMAVAAPKKASRKKATRKKTARKKAARKKAAHKPAKKLPAGDGSRKRSTRKAASGK